MAAKFGHLSLKIYIVQNWKKTLANSEITPQVVYSSLYPSMQSEQTNSKDEIDRCRLFVDYMKILTKFEEGSFHLAAKFGHFNK